VPALRSNCALCWRKRPLPAGAIPRVVALLQAGCHEADHNWELTKAGCPKSIRPHRLTPPCGCSVLARNRCRRLYYLQYGSLACLLLDRRATDTARKSLTTNAPIMPAIAESRSRAVRGLRRSRTARSGGGSFPPASTVLTRAPHAVLGRSRLRKWRPRVSNAASRSATQRPEPLYISVGRRSMVGYRFVPVTSESSSGSRWSTTRIFTSHLVQKWGRSAVARYGRWISGSSARISRNDEPFC
jgi:hypothetical protein